MATVSRYVIFIRAFLLSLVMGVPSGPAQSQDADSADWAQSSQAGTADAYFWYLRRNPAGQHVEEAISALRSLGALGGGGGAGGGGSDGPAARGLDNDPY